MLEEREDLLHRSRHLHGYLDFYQNWEDGVQQRIQELEAKLGSDFEEGHSRQGFVNPTQIVLTPGTANSSTFHFHDFVEGP